MSSNGIYVWDIKYGIPDNMETAYRFVADLNTVPESEPNPRMAAFGKKMAEFVRPALMYYDGDYALENIGGIACSTATTLERVYCFEAKPALLDEEVFVCAIIRAACENGLAVLENDWDIMFLPDGRQISYRGGQGDWRSYVAQGEAAWQQLLEEAEK